MIRPLTLAAALIIAGAATVTAQQAATHQVAPPPGAPGSLAAAPEGATLPQPGQPAQPAALARPTDGNKTGANKTGATKAGVTKAKAPKPARGTAAAAQKRERAAADQTRELARRLDVLLPGTKLGQPMDDPSNPSRGRQRADRLGIEGRDFAMPLDPKGEAGVVARGYHQDPSWYNPHGILGATLSLRRRF